MAMDPVQQTLAQQNSGTANGEGFGQFFVEGRRQGLMRRQIEGQEKQEERLQQRQDMLLPLEAQQNRLQNANLGIAAVSNLRKGIAETQVNAALPEILQLQIDYARAPDGFKNDQLYERAKNLAVRFPMAFREDMEGGKLMGQVQAAWFQQAQWDRNIQRFKDLEQQTGRRIQTINPSTGQFTFSNTVPGTLSSTGKLMADREALVEEGRRLGNMSKVVEFDRMHAEDLARANTLTKITTDPKTGQVITEISRGGSGSSSGSGGDVTTATQTKLESAFAESESALGGITKLRQTIANNPNAWGARGAGMDLVESALGTFDPQRESPNKVARLEANALFTQMVGPFKVDSGQMTNYERQKLEAVANVVDLGGNQRFATDKLNILEDLAVAKILRTARDLKKPVPNNALLLVEESEVVPLMRDGLLTEADAARRFSLIMSVRQKAASNLPEAPIP